MQTLKRSTLTALYTLGIGGGAIFDGVKIGLFTAAPALTLETVFGDLTSATFTTYALTAVTLAAAVDGNGLPILIADPTVFNPTNATNLPQVLIGAMITDTAGTTLICCGLFPTALNLTAANQTFHVTAKISLNPLQPSFFEGSLA